MCPSGAPVMIARVIVSMAPAVRACSAASQPTLAGSRPARTTSTRAKPSQAYSRWTIRTSGSAGVAAPRQRASRTGRPIPAVSRRKPVGPIVGATTQGRMATTRRWHVLVQALAQPRAGEARPDTTVDLPISTKTTPKPSRRPNSAIPKPSVPVCDSAQLTPRPVTTATTGRLRQLRPVTISRAQDEPDRNAPEANVGRGRETRADRGTDQARRVVTLLYYNCREPGPDAPWRRSRRARRGSRYTTSCCIMWASCRIDRADPSRRASRDAVELLVTE